MAEFFGYDIKKKEATGRVASEIELAFYTTTARM